MCAAIFFCLCCFCFEEINESLKVQRSTIRFEGVGSTSLEFVFIVVFDAVVLVQICVFVFYENAFSVLTS